MTYGLVVVVAEEASVAVEEKRIEGRKAEVLGVKRVARLGRARAALLRAERILGRLWESRIGLLQKDGSKAEVVKSSLAGSLL